MSGGGRGYAGSWDSGSGLKTDGRCHTKVRSHNENSNLLLTGEKERSVSAEVRGLGAEDKWVRRLKK
jgi:hypothetical protein